MECNGCDQGGAHDSQPGLPHSCRTDHPAPQRPTSPRPRERNDRRLNCSNSTGGRVARSPRPLPSRLLPLPANEPATWSQPHPARTTHSRSNCANSTYGAAAIGTSAVSSRSSTPSPAHARCQHFSISAFQHFSISAFQHFSIFLSPPHPGLASAATVG